MYLDYYSSSFDIAQNISHIKSERFLIHSHPYYELHFVIGGDMELIYGGQVVHVQPYGLTMIAPDVPHGIRVLSEKPYERYTVHFTEDMIQEECREMLFRIFQTERFPARNNHLPALGATSIPQQFQELIRMIGLPKEQRDVLAPALIQSLVTSIYIRMLNIVPLPDQEEKPVLTVNEIRNYIDMHYIEKLTLEQIASVFFCSKGYLNSVFRRETGIPIMQYVLHRRLQYAQALIENGYTAANACSMSGFSDYSNFYRAYVKHFGSSPRQSSDSETAPPAPQIYPSSLRTGPAKKTSSAENSQRTNIWELYHHDGEPDEDPAWLKDQ